MTTATYPEAIQNILSSLEDTSLDEIFTYSLDSRDRDLTVSLISSDACDFIAMDGDDAFLFIANDRTGEWDVKHIGKPVYEVEPEMVGDVDFDEFLKELQCRMRGVEVRQGSALNNAKSDFCQFFADEIEVIFDAALAEVQ